jgi:signal transduction histidine kinase/DNA-binding response OmpR family regulator/HPt (histidine-containing phosphotransfer) domain-containing protein
MVNYARPYIGLIPIFLLMALLVAFGVLTGHATRIAQQSVDHTRAVIQDTQMLFVEVLNAETGQRGYLLTENDIYLAPYNLAMKTIPATTEALKHEIADDAEQAKQFNELQDLIASKFEEINRTIALAQTGHRDEAIAIVRTNIGRNFMGDIRRHVNALIATEQTNLAQRQAHAEVTRTRVEFVTFTGAALAAVSAILLFVSLSRDQKRRAAAAVELVRLKDEAQAANRAKSDFLATMSHEIRTPMNGIIGMNGLLLDSPLNPQQEQFAKAVQVSAEMLLKVVNDILDISKLEAGRIEIESIDFSPAAIVESAVDALAVPAQLKGLEIAAQIHPNVPEWVRGDPSRLLQILLNLIGNALKFTAVGYIEIELSAEPSGPDEGVLRVVVTDTGSGIPEKARAQLFEKFNQADSSITRRYGGTGLGLAISKQLTLLMGGEIGAESTVGEGSRFWFTVKYGAPQTAPIAASVSQPDLLKGKRVIVVDDTAINRRAIAGQLESYGIIAQTVEEPGELLPALRAAQDDNKPFDVAILDQNMPGTSGISLARSIRAVRRFGDLKLILASSVGLPNPSDEARHVGFDDFLTKPLKRATLIESLCKVLGLEAAPAKAIAAWSASDSQVGPLNILVAEDNAINQQLISALLKKWGHKITLVETGFSAVSTALAADFDLILMDIQMPGMSGIEAAIRIRRATGPRGRIPIIALTAHVLEGIRDEVLEAGMQDHVGKPIEPAELATAIDRVMSDRAQTKTAKPAPGSDKTSTGDPTVLDEGLLNRLEVQIGRPMVAELAGMLLDQTPPKLVALRQTIATSDTVATRQLAHDICATAGNLGAFTVVNLSRQLEALGKNGIVDVPPQLIREIEQSFDAAAKVLRARYQP